MPWIIWTFDGILCICYARALFELYAHEFVQLFANVCIRFFFKHIGTLAHMHPFFTHKSTLLQNCYIQRDCTRYYSSIVYIACIRMFLDAAVSTISAPCGQRKYCTQDTTA